jgi:hypothetical protein
MVSDLTTEATLQPAEWGGISFPLGLNLLRNGSFEDGFVSSNRDGWQIELQLEGGAVRLDDVAPHSGRQSLLIEQTKPVTFPDAAWKLPDWGTFVKSANDGRGGGHVSLCQQVPVTPGKKYRYRVFFRSEGFRPEKREPGPGRGYVALTPYLFWQGLERGDPATTIPVRNIQENSNEWQAQLNAFSHGVAADSFTAPPGATGVIVSFKFTAALADTLPKVWVDDVELVESDLP